MAQSQDAGLSNRISRLGQSNSKASAIRKGDLKISGPIPYSGDLNKHATQVYTEAGPPYQPSEMDLRNQQISKSRRVSSALSSNPVFGGAEETSNENVPTTTEPQWAQQTASASGIPSFSESHRSTLPNAPHKLDMSNPRRTVTAPSPVPEMEPRKRRSGFKGVLRRMFSKRSKPTAPARPSPPKHTYSQSDPGVLAPVRAKRDTVPREPIIPTPPEETSNLQPIDEVQSQQQPPKTPTAGNQLPFPMNVNAPEIDPPEKLKSVEVPRVEITRRRRNSLPSGLFNSTDLTALAAIWGDSGKVVTANEIEALSPTRQSTEIGVAVSSPTVTSPTRLHRRSQSAGALRNLVTVTKPTPDMPIPVARTPRRRSAEIRYWRASMAGRSMSSEYSGAGDGSEQHDDRQRDEADKPRALVVDKSKGTPTPTETDRMHGFNFGDLKSSVSEHTPRPKYSNHTSDETVTTGKSGETAYQDSTEQFASSSRAPQTVIIDEAPKARARSSSTVRENFSRPTSIKNVGRGSQTSHSHSQSHSHSHSPADPPASSTSAQDPSNRPAKIPTPPLPLEKTLHSKPSHSSTHSSSASIPYTLPSAPADSYETRFHAVHIILNDERSKRKALEAQVASLHDRLLHLQHLVGRLRAEGKRDGSYPTPSPEMLQPSSEGEYRRQRYEEEMEDSGIEHSGYLPHQTSSSHHGHAHPHTTRSHVAWNHATYTPNDARPNTVISRFSKFTDEEDVSVRTDSKHASLDQHHHNNEDDELRRERERERTKAKLFEDYEHEDDDKENVSPHYSPTSPTSPHHQQQHSPSSSNGGHTTDRSASNLSPDQEVWETPLEESSEFITHSRSNGSANGSYYTNTNGNGNGNGKNSAMGMRSEAGSREMLRTPVGMNEDGMF